MKDTGSNRDLSSQEKRALLARLLREKAGQSSTRYPASFGQNALWFLHQTEPDSPAYNTAFAARIVSEPDIGVLQAVFQAFIDRHAALRTTFKIHENQLAQEVHAYRPVHFAQVDASGWGKDELSLRVAANYQLPFNLEEGPLFRATLFSSTSRDHVLLLTFHHIICDAWSIWLLVDEFRELYPAIKAGRPASLPVLSARYTDYVEWQRRMIEKDGGTALAYWGKQLSGELPLTNIDVDRSGGSAASAATHFFLLGSELFNSLGTLAKSEAVTLYTVLLAAFQILLHRYTGSKDVIVGSPTTGRSRAEFSGVVGYFVNPVALRASFEGDPSFTTFLKQVRKTLLEALGHQDFPFPLLVEKIQPRRDSTRSPIFQTLFAFQKPQQSTMLSNLLVSGDGPRRADLGGLEVESFPLAQMEGQFDLALEVYEDGGCALKYKTAILDANSIARMSRHFQILLESIVTDPRLPVSELRLLDDGEAHQITTACNHTGADYPLDRCIHQIIEDQVDRTPDRLCVEFGQRQITYRELNEQANQVAHSLRQLSAGVETLVGICLERSLEMVFGLLGILKAGSAYLPLDPSYPPERLAFMLRDSGVKLVLTQRKFTDQLEATGAQVFCLDEPPPIGVERSDPVSGVTPNNPAYMIYTSGSTGKPKGVVNTHRGICNRLLWMQTEYRLTAADRVLQKTPFSFDVSVWEFFWPLMTGARLVLAKPGGHQDPEYLIDLICRRNITTLHFVPSMLRVFLEGPGIERCISLRQVFCSGEALSYRLQEHFFSQSRAELHNLYGPTEAAVDVTFWRCERGSQRPSVPIGRPIANTQIYILDGHLKSVPIGLGGELFIGGEGLARGYRNRPALTAEKFLPNPFGPPGSRLYRTGDFARFLSDGAIEYLSRLDAQVKIRGFRVEPREVELALSAHSKVNEAVVLAQLDGQGTQRLIAYIVPVAGNPPSTSELHRFMRMKVPDFMVPSAFLLVDRLPLNPNGKIDRRALRILDGERPLLEHAHLMPRNEIERMVAERWQEVLQIDNIGIHDNFFELGGHSLLLIRVQTSLQLAFGVKLTLAEFFRFPTIYALAQHLGEQQSQVFARMSEGGLVENRIDRSTSFRDQRLLRMGHREKNLG